MTSDPQNCHLGVYTQFSDTSKTHTLGDISHVYIYIYIQNYKYVPHERGRLPMISLLFNPQHFLEETHNVHHGYYMSPFSPPGTPGVPEGAWVDASDSAKDQSL